MPNGVSCAYFAARNMVCGTKERNIFKSGIAAVQTTRTVDAVANSALLNAPIPSALKSGCSKFTNLVKKLLYPLVVLSGIYNTVTSPDKVRTGCSQAGGIASMMLFDTVSETALKSLQKRLSASDTFNNNKFARIGWYLLRGAVFASLSMAGYNLGSSAAETIVDKYRYSKVNKAFREDKFAYMDMRNSVFNDMDLQ